MLRTEYASNSSSKYCHLFLLLEKKKMFVTAIEKEWSTGDYFLMW